MTPQHVSKEYSTVLLWPVFMYPTGLYKPTLNVQLVVSTCFSYSRLCALFSPAGPVTLLMFIEDFPVIRGMKVRLSSCNGAF